MKISVSCVQFRPESGNPETNIGKISEWIRKVMKAHPETNLIIFPELAVTGYECSKEEFRSMAEIVPGGASMKAVGRLARQYGIYVVYGFAEQDPAVKDVLYNSAVLIDDRGVAAGSYRKVHPFDMEKQWCRPGCGYPLMETKLGKLGIFICWDTAFPEVARAYALQGADLLVVCTNWEKPYEKDWDLITKARAFDNTLHLVASNRVGDDKTLGFFGRSKIIDPLGNEIAALDREEEGFISAEIDLSRTAEERSRYYTFFKDRRPDTYGELTRRY